MTDVYEMMMKRRSVRDFEDKEVPESILNKLLDVATNAPSAGNVQPISIVVIKEAETRKELAKIVENQPWVKNAPVSMIFCMDHCRLKKWVSISNTKYLGNNSFSWFMMSYADVMIAAQNVALLAENYGLGAVYVGSIQLSLTKARKLLSLPKFVLPLIILSIGYPNSIPKFVPKLNRNIITHNEKYEFMSEQAVSNAYEEKYGDFRDIDDFLKKNYIESIEFDKQLQTDVVNKTKERIENKAIKNPAQFLFELRYPSEAMVALNRRQFRELRKAGFEFI